MITTDYTTNIVAEYSIAKRALLLSADVELNPEPVALDDILGAVMSSETRIVKEIKTVQTDITHLKEDVTSLKQESSKMKASLEEINGTQNG